MRGAVEMMSDVDKSVCPSPVNVSLFFSVGFCTMVYCSEIQTQCNPLGPNRRETHNNKAASDKKLATQFHAAEGIPATRRHHSARGVFALRRISWNGIWRLHLFCDCSIRKQENDPPLQIYHPLS
jgi:hypothetical protein